jgi:acyl-CoA synthetase (AMP-forming)/AMP-acid ligase II
MLASGASISTMNKFDAEIALTLIQNRPIEIIVGIPTMMNLIIEKLSDNFKISSVKNIILSSAPTPKSLADEIKKVFNNAKLRITYGTTELGPGLFGNHPSGLETPDTSVGFPIKGVECRLRNSVLEVKSIGMMSNYIDNTVQNNFTKDGFFITNDIFEVDNNGFYYFKGRADEMFTCGGDNLYPSDLETLLETNETIDSAVVIGMEDDIKGKKPYCFVVLKKDYKLDESDLKKFLSKTLKFNLIPRKIWQIDQIPLTNLNKPDKKYLINLAKELLK